MSVTAYGPPRGSRLLIGLASLALSASASLHATPPPLPAVRCDFDGDGKTDPVVVRKSGGNLVWYVLRSSDGQFQVTPWGLSTDVVVPADYDGDNKTDVAVFRPGVPSTFFVLQSSNGALLGAQTGPAIDIATVMGDYEGDHKADLSVYRLGPTPTSQNSFLIRRSSDAVTITTAWGLFGDAPIPADYDGDLRADIAVRRGSIYYLLQSTAGFAAGQYGLDGDLSVPADYDGDGLADLAVARPIAGALTWYLRRSIDGAVVPIAWGFSTDIPVPGDYDGDGKTDVAVWRPTTGTFFALRSSDSNWSVTNWGISTDFPTANAYVH
jgi:hypothetical protein